MLLCLRFEIHMEPVVSFVILVYGVGRTDEQSKNYQKVPEERHPKSAGWNGSSVRAMIERTGKNGKPLMLSALIVYCKRPRGAGRMNYEKKNVMKRTC